MSTIYRSSSDAGEVDFVDLEDEDIGVVYCQITLYQDEPLMLAEEDDKENGERNEEVHLDGLTPASAGGEIGTYYSLFALPQSSTFVCYIFGCKRDQPSAFSFPNNQAAFKLFKMSHVKIVLFFFNWKFIFRRVPFPNALQLLV